MKIGVFDSGVGGLSVARAIEKAFPGNEVLFRHDSPANFPYANKTPNELLDNVAPVLQTLVEDGCDVIVVACNTVSTTIIGPLRQKFSVPLVALEPMVKPASSMTKSGVIAVCATPTTLASERYKYLKEQYAKTINVIEPNCADWSTLIERNEMTKKRIAETIEPSLAKGADVIVLGCTHYHWIAKDIDQICRGRATVIHPEEAIVRRLRVVL